MTKFLKNGNSSAMRYSYSPAIPANPRQHGAAFYRWYGSPYDTEQLSHPSEFAGIACFFSLIWLTIWYSNSSAIPLENCRHSLLLSLIWAHHMIQYKYSKLPASSHLLICIVSHGWAVTKIGLQYINNMDIIIGLRLNE